MKKYFMLGLAVIFALTAALIAYGAYLNQQGELQIMRRMEDRALPVHGAKSEVRELHPRIAMPTLSLRASDMADAVALIDGRITAVHAEKDEAAKKAAAEAIILPVAKEAGLPFTIDELIAYEQEKAGELAGEISDDEMAAAAGGGRLPPPGERTCEAACCYVGVGFGEVSDDKDTAMCIFVGVSTGPIAAWKQL